LYAEGIPSSGARREEIDRKVTYPISLNRTDLRWSYLEVKPPGVLDMVREYKGMDAAAAAARATARGIYMAQRVTD
jgi:hypothetical protein